MDTEEKATGDPLVRRPKQSGSLSLQYVREAWTAGMSATHTGRRLDVTDLAPFGNVRGDPFTVVDLVLERRLSSVTPYVKVENLTDERYQEIFGYPSARRRVMGE